MRGIPQWFFTYKIYHLFFWFAYHFGWWSLSSGPWEAANNILFSPYTTKFVFYVVFQALAVYLNLYYLIPRYLQKGKYALYVMWVIVSVLLAASFIISGYYLTALLNERTFEELFGQTSFVQLLITNSLPSTLASMTLAMSIKLAKNWIGAQQRQQLLEKEKLEAELKFLKSQFNPHFLFNTINSIFVLIHKNPHMASDSLAKFSDLLRYQLYECNEQKIPLQREMNYLENFIELGRLRLDRVVEVNINLDTKASGHWEIAPFVLMPFVENAFKHVSQIEDYDNWLRIQLSQTEQGIILDISNSKFPIGGQSLELLESGGIGLANVKRRLALVYPDNHTLEIFEDQRSYRAVLTLGLDPLHESSYPIKTLA